MITAHLHDRVSVAGVGCTKFGEHAGRSLDDLAADAARAALDDAGLDALEIDAVIATAPSLGRALGLGVEVPLDGATATASLGVTLAAQAIAAGAIDTALVIAAGAAGARDRDPTSHEVIAQAYCAQYGISIEMFDTAMYELCRARRLHGSLTPDAALAESLEAEATRHGYRDARAFWCSPHNPFVSWPVRARSTLTPASGACAIVVTRGVVARGLAQPAVELVGFGTAATLAPDPTDFSAERLAAERAFEMARIRGRDLDYLHVHDASAIASLWTAERLGYLSPGRGLHAATDGGLRFDGDRPMTTNGGCHAFGHAGAATAGADLAEAVRQLRGQAGARKLARCSGLAAVGGLGAAQLATMLVLRADGSA